MFLRQYRWCAAERERAKNSDRNFTETETRGFHHLSAKFGAASDSIADSAITSLGRIITLQRDLRESVLSTKVLREKADQRHQHPQCHTHPLHNLPMGAILTGTLCLLNPSITGTPIATPPNPSQGSPTPTSPPLVVHLPTTTTINVEHPTPPRPPRSSNPSLSPRHFPTGAVTKGHSHPSPTVGRQTSRQRPILFLQPLLAL